MTLRKGGRGGAILLAIHQPPGLVTPKVRLARCRILLAAVLLSIGASCPPRPPDPTPEPTPTPTPTPDPGQLPPKDQAVFLELLLRQDAPHLKRGGQPFFPSGAVQCCMATDVGMTASVYEKTFGVKQDRRPRRPRPLRVGGLGARAEINSRWPGISIEAQNFFHQQGGANFFETRIAPYLGDADHESEWADIGGPVLPGQWPLFNSRWWDETRVQAYHAGTLGANFKVIWDSWYGKTCKNNSQPCDWPEAEQQAWGETFTAGHKRFIDKIVEELGCMANVAWGVDNEGELVPRRQRSYYEAVYWAIRDAEQRFPCKMPDGSTAPMVHMIWTNWPEIGDGPFDAVSTHEDAPLTRSFWGKHSENNERNGTTYSAEEDHARFCQARAQGNHYWFWRAEDSDALMREKLVLRKQGCGSGPTSCFLPGGNDPNWIDAPTPRGDRQIVAGVEAIKLTVGERCGAADKYAALGLVAEEARARGYCASVWGDAVAFKCPDNVENGECALEFHLVAFTDGCWAANPDVLPKFTWRYNTKLPSNGIDEAPLDEILCRPHVPVGTYDCTNKRDGAPIAPEGDPQRRARELDAAGNADPTYRLEVATGSLQLTPLENPMQFKITGSGSGRVTCTVPATGAANVCNAPVSR